MVYICGDPRERTLAQIVSADLARIRIVVSVSEDEQCPGPDNVAAQRKSRRADLLLVNGWPFTQSDERDPAQVLDQALTGSLYGSPLPPGPWNAGAFRKRLDAARPLRGAARVTAYRRIADELTRTGPIAVFGGWVWSEYFSPKVGCRVFQSVYRVADLGALCKRS